VAPENVRTGTAIHRDAKMNSGLQPLRALSSGGGLPSSDSTIRGGIVLATALCCHLPHAVVVSPPIFCRGMGEKPTWICWNVLATKFSSFPNGANRFVPTGVRINCPNQLETIHKEFTNITIIVDLE